MRKGNGWRGKEREREGKREREMTKAKRPSSAAEC